MTDADVQAIKARLAAATPQFPVEVATPAEIAALVAEVERLRNEVSKWNDDLPALLLAGKDAE